MSDGRLALIGDECERGLPGFERDEERTEELRKSSSRALREELLRAAYECEGAATLLSVARDEGEPPAVRCEAIQALGKCSDQAEVQNALLELLERSHWFSCGLERKGILSLELVILALPADTPLVHARLVALHSELASLSDGERKIVESLLEDSP